MDFWLQQKSLALNDLDLLCRQCYAYCDETAEARLTWFNAIK